MLARCMVALALLFIVMLAGAFIAPAREVAGRVRITKDFLFGGAEISPFQYGQFVEYLCDLIPAMWAEKLCDGSFEGLSTYMVSFDRQIDNRQKPWYASGALRRGRETHDFSTK